MLKRGGRETDRPLTTGETYETPTNEQTPGSPRIQPRSGENETDQRRTATHAGRIPTVIRWIKKQLVKPPPDGYQDY